MHKERHLSHRKVQYRLNQTKTWKILINATKAMIKVWTHKVSYPQIQEYKRPVATSHDRKKTEIPANFDVL